MAVEYTLQKFGFENNDAELVAEIQIEAGGTKNDLTQVAFTLPDGTTVAWLAAGGGEVTESDLGSNLYKYTYLLPSPVEGIYTITIYYNGVPTEKYVIGDYSDLVECLITKTINDEYDCLLLQQVEVLRQGIFSGDEQLARMTYENANGKCTSCVGDVYSGTVNGARITIIDNAYVIT